MNKPTVVAVNISEQRGKRKHIVQGPVTITMLGIEGDAHAGDWHRQLSLLAQESIDKMQGHGMVLQPGDFAENITTQGLNLPVLPIGTRLHVGPTVIMEVTQIGKTCHLDCEVRRLVGDCVMPREGIFTRVITPGMIQAGDIITVIDKGETL